ncbi:MAG: hypothetical protein ABI682_11655 [Acidobacteriota bacterium]
MWRRPVLRALNRVLARRESDGWLVGGAPRDILRGRVCPDLDVVIAADPFDVAAELSAAGFGSAVRLSEKSPRVARVAGSIELDLAELTGGGIREDLARRDFTVNAVAISLSRKEWIDPYGGIEDLARGTLRMISEENLRDDPLRTLRAARFIATMELAPDRATSAACRRTAPLLASAAPERIRVELEKLLGSSHVLPALAWAARTFQLGTALGRLLSPHRATGLVRRAPLDHPALVRQPPARRVELRLALLAAGLRLTPDETAAWLLSRRFSRATAGRIALLLRLAGRAARLDTADARWGWVRDAATEGGDALLLGKLLCPGATRPLSAARRTLRAARKPPRVTGRDILAWVRIAPGPRVGEILREVEIEGVRGRVRSRAQAKRWLLRSISAAARAET